jgi:hypothetical protein
MIKYLGDYFENWSNLTSSRAASHQRILFALQKRLKKKALILYGRLKDSFGLLSRRLHILER